MNKAKLIGSAIMGAIMILDFALVPSFAAEPSYCVLPARISSAIVEQTQSADWQKFDGDIYVGHIKKRRLPMYTPSEEDVEALSRMAWGEARGCGDRGIEAVMWVALHRLDAGYADTVLGVVSAKGQFYGYSPNHPVTDEIRAIAERVLTAHHYGDEPLIPPEYLWFSGNGIYNTFRDNAGNRMTV